MNFSKAEEQRRGVPDAGEDVVRGAGPNNSLNRTRIPACLTARRGGLVRNRARLLLVHLGVMPAVRPPRRIKQRRR
jgi:hypothetical protein